MRSGFKTLATRLGLALLGVAIFYGYALAPALAFLPYVALVPWAILYTDPRQRRVSAFYFLLVGYLSWIVCYRMTTRFGWFVPPAMALFFTPAWLLFPLVMRPVQRLNLPRSLTVPIVWVAVEWARVLLATGHFDLFALGYSQARFAPLVQIADVTGVYGISFLVAAVNGLLADAWFALRAAEFRPRPVWRNRRIRLGAAAIALAFGSVSAYGVARLAGSNNVGGPRLAVVQPNVAHTLRNHLGTSLAQLYQTDEAVDTSSADLIVWPENAIPDDFERRAAYHDDLAWLASRKHAWMLVGAQGRAEWVPGRTTNSAFLVDDTGALRGRYDKQILFPFSEYIPLDFSLGAFAPPLQQTYRGLIREAWGFLPTGTRGRRLTLFALPWNGGVLPFATLIGAENSYPPLVAEAGRAGARFFVNITSEGEVEGVSQEQLLRVSILRAIENRIAYVRCGNSGISGFIDPQGRVRHVLRDARGGTIATAGELTARVALSSGGPTIYAASHDGFALLCVAAALFLLARATLRGGPTMTPIPAPAATAAVMIAGLMLLAGCGGPDADFARACPDEASCGASLSEAARAYRASDSAEVAVGFFDRVAGTYPSLAAEARPYRAYFLDRSGETRAALAEYRTSVKESPSARTYAMLGNLCSRIGDAAAALEAHREAHRLAPEDPRLLFLVARSLWETGDPAAATAVTAVLAMDREDPDALTLSGLLALERGDEAAARDAFQRAAAVGPASPEPRYQLSRLAWRAGRKDDARRWLHELRAVEATPGHGTAD